MVSPILFGPTIALDKRYSNQWFLTDGKGKALTASDCAALNQLELRTKLGYLQVRAPGMLLLELALDVLEDDDSVRLQASADDGTPIAAIDEGVLAATWFSHVIGQPCLLLKKDPGHPDSPDLA
ncbi:MAG TPA: MOSC N-terminal beta barrel domain-containing protein [Paenalcaligenes hominis]|uniref:MOSC N-terminal beta barrel domain-containing protein n=1 Tax=Paenalcaligenes hominis TaxID=643674 RepID=A0A9D3ABC5_9BURK|nr:MOSC N-terminal beta barrel domain-containing protein [Paenalcaligenes hominis]